MIHFLCCVHGNGHTRTHDAIHDTIIVIVWNVGFHVGQKQLHALPSTTFNSSCRRIDIVLIKDDIRTLANVVIINPTWVDLFPQSCVIQGFVALDVVQIKEKTYRNWHPVYQFFPWAIEVFGCLHKHVDVFLHDYVNAIWNFKGIKGLHLFTLVTFLPQKVLITLQRIQVSSILIWVVIVSLVTSRLPPNQNTPSITTINVLQAIGFWHVNMVDLPQTVNYGHA